MKKLLVISVLSIVLSGCSYQAWYQGFVEGQKYQCNKLSGQERQNCMESIHTDYDRYERERQESIKRTD